MGGLTCCNSNRNDDLSVEDNSLSYREYKTLHDESISTNFESYWASIADNFYWHEKYDTIKETSKIL